ncbi:MAG TPA: lipocalin-like domain-containing protein [Bryobacteraceae bacterium]|nr:lipocalin-like domain-containing protein [Bryobacteraceae bacterium]
MQRRDVLALLGLAGAAQLSAGPSAREQFFGVWQCIKQYNVDKDGSEIPVAPRQRGHISWDRSGRVWVLLYNEGRKPPANPRMPTLEEYREMNSGLMTYFGTYDVDEAKQTITHHLQAAASPGLIGVDLVRHYEFSGNRVKLRFPGEMQRHIVFERLPDA